MPQPIVYVDVSTIREGKLEELEGAMTHLVAFVEANMPRLISYGFFLDPDRTQMTVVAVHPDSESLEQLRALQSGWEIACDRAVEAIPPGVDTAEDLDVMRAHFAALET